MKFDINRMDPPSDEALSIFSQKPEIKVDNSYFNEFHNFFPLVFNVPTKTNPDKVLWLYLLIPVFYVILV